jgi:mRNA interferase RelE/StbE
VGSTTSSGHSTSSEGASVTAAGLGDVLVRMTKLIGYMIPVHMLVLDRLDDLERRLCALTGEAPEGPLAKADPTRTGIMGILANLRADPRPLGAIALQGHRPYLRLRIGDYRIIYAVDDEARVVTVTVAGHRRDIYRNLDR